MVEIGRIALMGAFPIAIFAVFASIIGARKEIPTLTVISRRAVLVACALVTLGVAGLLYAILTHDFQVSYVYGHSDRGMSLPYLISSFWAGNEGSILLWAWLLSLFAAIVVFQTRSQNKILAPYVIATIMTVLSFFLGLVVYVSDPFVESSIVPPHGLGLNPLLQNPGMIFHPTTLYLGYVGFTVPFAFAIAALATGQLGPQWIRSTRRWTLFAWLFLSAGNLLGAKWAYAELGWGGYWAWDPVENASLMPWLVATAYLHSVMIQQRRDMLKVWNVVLIAITFLLTIFGTFITRSGVLESVHDFGESSLGNLLLIFMAFVSITFIALLIYRWPQLRTKNELDSLVSRESSFLLNNLLLVGITFMVFLGTVFPLISEAVRDVKVSVGPSFFNTVGKPLFLLLIVLMGVCPLIGWRRASRENLIRNFLLVSVIALVGGIALYTLGVKQIYVTVAAALCIFVVGSILLEVLRGIRAHHRVNRLNYASAFASLVWRNKPRYGGYLVHLGVVAMAIAIFVSGYYKSEASATLSPGESFEIQDYVLTYQDLERSPSSSGDTFVANIKVSNGNGQEKGMIKPARIFDRGNDSVTEVAIRSTLTEDLYVVLLGWDHETED